jgi:hypothetical protein
MAVQSSPRAENGLDNHASRIAAQLWDDFTLLKDENAED